MAREILETHASALATEVAKPGGLRPPSSQYVLLAADFSFSTLLEFTFSPRLLRTTNIDNNTLPAVTSLLQLPKAVKCCPRMEDTLMEPLAVRLSFLR